MAEWSKALAWKVSIRQNRIEGSNPSRSAIDQSSDRFICGKDIRLNDFPAGATEARLAGRSVAARDGSQVEKSVGLRCLFGHDSVDETFRGMVLIGTCSRCGKPTIRGPGGRAYVISGKILARMDTADANPISARRALHLARKKAFFLSRLPRRRHRWGGYYDN